MSRMRGPGVIADAHRLRRVMTLVPWPMRGRLAWLLLLSFLVTLLDMAAVAAMLPLMQLLMAPEVVPGPVRAVLVPVLGTDDPQTLLIALAAGIGVAFLAKNLALLAIRWWSLGVTTSAMAAAQSELLGRYVHAPYARHRRRARSDILQSVSGALPTVFGAVLLGYITLATDVVQIVSLLVILLVLAPEASLAAALLFGGVALVLSQVLKPHALRLGLAALDLDKASWRQLNPAIEGFRETRIFRREALFLEQYRRNRREYAHVTRAQTLFGEMPKYVLEIAMIAGLLLVAAVLFLARDATSAFGLLAVFAAASMRLIPALNRAVATANGIRGGQPSLEFVVRQIDELADEDGASDREVDPVLSAEPVPSEPIVVEGVSYRYPDGVRDVLQDVSVRIERGRTVALVGSSGAGKTTFADLLISLVEPTEGTITVGEMSVSREPRRWMREIAVVSQHVYLWDAPIRDLITFGLPEDQVDEALLHDVIARARLTTLIDELPEGVGSWVGDGGARLSGGQIQRLGIARALYARPRVLILDEATSALDNETEHEITRTIEALRGEVTVVVIAHRLSTVKDADEILFFAEGRLQDKGTMRELQERQPGFARLVELGSLH